MINLRTFALNIKRDESFPAEKIVERRLLMGTFYWITIYAKWVFADGAFLWQQHKYAYLVMDYSIICNLFIPKVHQKVALCGIYP